MSLVSQTLSQLGNLKTLEQEIIDVLSVAEDSLSAKQIGARISNPPDSETLSREIYLLKKEGKVEHDPLAIPPKGSRGNVGMYRLPLVPRQEADKPKAKGLPKASKALVMACLESIAPNVMGTNVLAERIGCDRESTQAVLLGLYAGLKIDRHPTGPDVFAWFIPKAAPVCDQQNEKSDTQPALTTTGDTQIDMTPGAEERLLPGGELAVPSKARIAEFAAMITPPRPPDPTVEAALAERDTALARQSDTIVQLRAVIAMMEEKLATRDKLLAERLAHIADDLDVAEPDDAEFAIYSSGMLDMHFTDLSVTLRKPVLEKLRTFLGLFRDEAA